MGHIAGWKRGCCSSADSNLREGNHWRAKTKRAWKHASCQCVVQQAAPCYASGQATRGRGSTPDASAPTAATAASLQARQEGRWQVARPHSSSLSSSASSSHVMKGSMFFRNTLRPLGLLPLVYQKRMVSSPSTSLSYNIFTMSANSFSRRLSS